MILFRPRSRGYRLMKAWISSVWFGWQLNWWFLFGFRLSYLGWIWSTRWTVYHYLFLSILRLTYCILKMLQEGHGWIHKHSQRLCPKYELSGTIKFVISEYQQSISHSSWMILFNFIILRLYCSIHGDTYSRILHQLSYPSTLFWSF